jgi:uncharacterized membrane protein YgcG
MTERRGERARWTGAALVAPLGAVVFSGTTAWAMHHDPHAVAATAKPVVQAAPAPDATLVAMRKSLLSTAKQVATLRGQVANLRATAASLRGAASAAASSGSNSSSGANSTASSGGGSSAPIVRNLPAPGPAPATNTTTGGS